MNTQQSHVNKEQEAASQPTRLDPQRATEQGQLSAQGVQSSPSPVQPFPPPTHPRGSLVLVVVTAMIVLVLVTGTILLAQLGKGPGTQNNPTPAATGTVVATPAGNDTTTTVVPGVVLGPQACPAGVQDPAHWNPIVSAPPDIVSVQQVSCGSLKGTSSLQAVVLATRIVGGGPVLRNVYVFDNITAARPKLLFKLFNLYKGDAKISGYSTLMTAEVDRDSSLNTGKTDAQMTPDLFREFAWSADEGTLTQVAFPGLYPDLTRYQAEADQSLIAAGNGTWKNDAVRVAQSAAVKLFNWQRTVLAPIVSGGGSHDVGASVMVEEAPIPGTQFKPTATMMLSRLEGKTQNMWVVTAVKDGSAFTFSNIESGSLITSPVRFEGTGSAFEGEIGRGLVLDHLYTPIGQGRLTATGTGMGMSAYANNIAYSTSFKQGVQEGVLEAQQVNGGLSDEMASAVMVKVLLNPEPGVALGTVPCPDTVKDASHWNTLLGLNGDTDGVMGVSCANLKGTPSLQALVTVFHRAAHVQDVYVFDAITAARPVQLFAVRDLYQGSAAISNYNTVMTAQVDRGSSANQGKTGDSLTVDLFREFRWSAGVGGFVQVAFPGIYPDLTRYQAELDQRSVNAGEGAWKNDAAGVSRNLAVTLLHWSTSAQTNVVSGGGPRDVAAVVQVQSTSPDHPTITVTLSRLEGDTHNLWVATAVADGTVLSVSSPAKWEQLRSPVSVKGISSSFEGDVGTAFVLDHLYKEIGHAKGVAATSGKTAFTATVAYSASFHGVQEGVLAYYLYSLADGAIARAVMVKVLIAA